MPARVAGPDPVLVSVLVSVLVPVLVHMTGWQMHHLAPSALLRPRGAPDPGRKGAVARGSR